MREMALMLDQLCCDPFMTGHAIHLQCIGFPQGGLGIGDRERYTCGIVKNAFVKEVFGD